MTQNLNSGRVMAIAVASGKVGMVFFVDGELMDWELSVAASKTEEQAQKRINKWLEFYSPDVLVTEEPNPYSRKSEHSNAIIKAIAKIASAKDRKHLSISRIQKHANKYEEARYFVDKFPQIAPWMPEPRQMWEPEPRNTIYFEAMALAEQLQV